MKRRYVHRAKAQILLALSLLIAYPTLGFAKEVVGLLEGNPALLPATQCIGYAEPIDDAEISSKFGSRRHRSEIAGKHSGVDFRAPVGTSVFSAATGEIIEIGRNPTYGRFLKVSHEDGMTTMYAHLSRINRHISVGSKVRQGTIIGYVGRSGRVTGANLHFEVQRKKIAIDPISFLEKRWTECA